MAIDSRQKRHSIINLSIPFRNTSLPIPDGTIGQADRQQLLYSYAGILWDSEESESTTVTFTPAIYVGQSWTLTLDTNIDVSSATTKQIRLRKPDGTKENKTASVVDTTKLRVSLSVSDTNQNGDWLFQTYVVIAGANYLGETFTQEVKRIFN